MKNGILKQLSAGQMLKSQSEVIRAEKSAPTNACSVKVLPTEAETINSLNISQISDEVIILELNNEGTKDALYVIGSSAYAPLADALYGLKSESGVTYAQNTVAAKDNGGDAALGTREISRLANFGGLIVDSIKVFTTDAIQRMESLKKIKTNLNFESFVKEQHIVKTDADLNYSILADCITPIDAFNGLIYKLGAGKKATLEMNVVAQGVSTKNYSSKASL